MNLTPSELDRYARHIVLREIGGPGQVKLKAAHVAMIGAGGLGSPALLYLAAAGVGKITLIDDDVVSLSNLQRQVLHGTSRVGMAKTESAALALEEVNPHVQLNALQKRLSEENAKELLADADIVLDGSDSFETRYLINRTCVALKKPLLAAAMSQWEGQVSLYDPENGTPCYACIFPTPPAPEQAPNCAETGIMGALAGIIGSIMASETIKHITGAGQTLRSEMLIYDALWNETRKLKLKPDPSCEVCGGAK